MKIMPRMVAVGLVLFHVLVLVYLMQRPDIWQLVLNDPAQILKTGKITYSDHILYIVWGTHEPIPSITMTDGTVVEARDLAWPLFTFGPQSL